MSENCEILAPDARFVDYRVEQTLIEAVLYDIQLKAILGNTLGAEIFFVPVGVLEMNSVVLNHTDILLQANDYVVLSYNNKSAARPPPWPGLALTTGYYQLMQISYYVWVCRDRKFIKNRFNPTLAGAQFDPNLMQLCNTALEHA